MHGLREKNPCDTTAKCVSDTNDHEVVIKAIFREIKVGSVPKSCTRLGKPNAGAARPIKVTMGTTTTTTTTISEKDNIMEKSKYVKQGPYQLRKTIVLLMISRSKNV